MRGRQIPNPELQAAGRHPRRGREHPGGFADEHPLCSYEPCCAETREGALHRPRTGTQQHLEVVDPAGVLLGQPGQHLDVTTAQQLVLSAFRRPGRARHTTRGGAAENLRGPDASGREKEAHLPVLSA
jgi:hypothetical protein